MPDRAGTLERLAAEIAAAVLSARWRFAGDELIRTLASLGVRFTDELLQRQLVTESAAAIVSAAQDLAISLLAFQASVDSGDIGDIAAAGSELATGFAAFGTATEFFASALSQAAPTLPLVTVEQVAALTNDFRRKIRDSLIVDHITMIPGVALALAAVGIVERIHHPGDATDVTKPAWVERRLRPEYIFPLLTSPSSHLAELYEWGSPSFDGQTLFRVLEDALQAVGLPAFLHEPTATRPRYLEAFAVDLAVSDTVPPGLAIDVLLPFSGSVSRSQSLANPEYVSHVELAGAVGYGTSGILLPPANLSLVPASGEINGYASARLTSAPGSKATLLSVLGGSRVDAALALEGAAHLRWDSASLSATTDFLVSGSLRDGRILVETEEADGFITSVVGSSLAAPFNVEFSWNLERGLQIKGGLGLSATLPVNGTAGPIAISALYVEGRVDGAIGSLAVGLAVGVSLGPVQISVDKIGINSRIEHNSADGYPFDLSVGFLRPTGAGISIESGPISGSGFLTFANDRYTGALQLRVNQIAMSAFGVIDTKLPGGKEGFSFVILISAEFQAIQLGLGFTLNGVGGLAGINRTVDIDALRDMVRSGKVDKFLFPAKPEKNATQIISNLSAAFPPAANRHVFAPMAKIGWGTPSIIEGKLGLALEVPAPFRLSLLGNVRADLPKKPDGGKAALIKMKMDVLGVLDIAAKDLAIDARLHDSNVGGFPISGDMAMRLNWGAQPNFAMAVGGFNPGFAVPPNFPALERIKIEFGSGENPSISAQAYLAITSNTAQVGARAELKASGSGITLHGWIGFDALFIFTPFQFIAEIDAGVRVEYRGRGKGIQLHATLSGPGPWKIKGKVCVSILFWDACLSFSKTFGKSRTYELPEINPWPGTSETPGLDPALSDARNWQAVLPEGATRVVTTRPLPSGLQAIDPLGAATVRQKVVPLNQKIERFGSVPLKEARLFKLQDARIEGSESGFDLATIVPVKEYFAPAQFQEMKDAERLSAPAFEELDAGFTLRSLDHEEGSIVTKNVEYETSFIGVQSAVPPDDTFTAGQLSGMIRRSRGARVDASGSGAERFVDLTKVPKVTFHPPRWVVAFKETLEPESGADEGSWTSARNQLRGMFAGKQHAVVPAHESHAGL